MAATTDMLYRSSLQTAVDFGEKELWKQSFQKNVACKEQLDQIITDHFDGMCLHGDLLAPVISVYGTDRVRWILANTVQVFKDDGRFRPETKEWAHQLAIPADQNNYRFALTSHPELVNAVIEEFRTDWEERECLQILNLF